MQATAKILVTNDDGIRSSALWLLAETLCDLGEVTIVAPSIQHSGAGRSYTGPDGSLVSYDMPGGCRVKAAYSVEATPAKAVVLALGLLLKDDPPDLVVSGINYGENPGTSIISSGTIGAASEAVLHGVRALAVSRAVPEGEYLRNSESIDFSVSAHFARKFAQLMLTDPVYRSLSLLKVDVPANATPHTRCKAARLSSCRYFEPVFKTDAHGEMVIDYRVNPTDPAIQPGDDIYTLLVEQLVAVTPLTLDMTAPIDLRMLERDC
ncbi:MAG TPA: 5'/3'-nucleotidase SurE [Chloroflexi bacterium]|nr:5'/3'-nucleotidase SurE [Chloroflexota bacterium]